VWKSIGGSNMKEEFEVWFRKSGWNENGEDDFLCPDYESPHTYVEEFVECAYQAFLYGKENNK
jgi:hypothetical protein